MLLTNKVKVWVSTFRLRTLPLALASMFAGGFLAKMSTCNCFDYSIFALSCITTILLQILSNIANDYGDAQNGADTADRVGPQRAVSSGLISHKEMKTAIVAFVTLSLLSGIALLWISLKSVDFNFLLFLILGVISIIAAVTYTAGKSPYGYKGLGDASVFIFFGLVGVIGSYYLYSNRFDLYTVPIAIVFGLLSTSVLNANNIRDIETDFHTGKNTLAVKLGKKSAVAYQISIIIISASILLTFLLIYHSKNHIAIAAISLIFIFIIIKNKALFHIHNAEKQTNILKTNAMLTFLISLILFLFF